MNMTPKQIDSLLPFEESETFERKKGFKASEI